MRDASLDDFFGSDAEDDESEADSAVETDAEPEETDPAAPESTPETAEAEDEPTLTVEAATPTYDFSPDGATCEACGETVEIRWHDPDGGMVCADCKGW